MSSNERALIDVLRENICSDVLNQYDASVGLYPVTDIEDWAENEAQHHDRIDILAHNKETVLFHCENKMFQIYQTVRDGEVLWDIRQVLPKE